MSDLHTRIQHAIAGYHDGTYHSKEDLVVMLDHDLPDVMPCELWKHVLSQWKDPDDEV